MARAGRYSQELRERAVRMFIHHRDEYESWWAAMRSIAEMLGTPLPVVRSHLCMSTLGAG